MSDSINLSAETRELNGKGPVRELRKSGKIPAVIYGDKKDPLPIALERKDITKVYNTGRIMATLLEIDVDGKNNRVIARDIQLDPVKDIILHADFLRVSKGTKIAVEVQVNFLNEETCPGLKQGGVLNVVRYAVELLCPAEEIPEFIELDLAEAEIGASLHISDINLPDGIVPTITARDFTVATIAAPAGLTDDEDEIEGEEGEEGEEGTAEDAGEESSED
ncbi:MAG: 50S ribosomal protein L25/general stress protein Ctc [Parvibaculales bacterium]